MGTSDDAAAPVLVIDDHAFVLTADEGPPWCREHNSWDCSLYLDDEASAALEDGATEG
jgi:hypothetical protein